jgi:hypothetical protein
MIEFVITNIVVFLVLFGILGLISIFSLIGLFFFFKKMWFMADQSTILLELLEDFKDHLDNLNQADKLFGEPSIVNLIEHSNFLLENIKIFLRVFDFMKAEENRKLIEEYEEEENNF